MSCLPSAPPPAIGAAPGWPKAFAAGAGAMWINTAGPHEQRPRRRCWRPPDPPTWPGRLGWLDPVAMGAGAAAYDDVVKALLAFHPTVIRGNASELIALSGGGAGGKGVETTANAAEALGAVKSLATATNHCRGERGRLTTSRMALRSLRFRGGDVRLTKVTGGRMQPRCG